MSLGSHVRLEHRSILDGSYNRRQADGKDTTNNCSFSLKFDYFLAPRVYVGALNLVETDQFQRLSFRNPKVSSWATIFLTESTTIYP
jgi:hypothetical protein